jgi:hypothetical protein
MMAAGCTFSSIPTAPAIGGWPTAEDPCPWGLSDRVVRGCTGGTGRSKETAGASQARKEQKCATRLSAENTFEIVAREWCENQKDGWTTGCHDHVVTRLEADVFPELGSRHR